MRKKYLFLTGILLLVLIAVGYGLYQFYKKPATVVTGDADVVIAADTLYGKYQKDEANADKTFLNKVIEVSGTVSDVQHTKEGVVVLLSVPGQPGGINCAGDATQPVPANGDKLTVKGRCSGFLADVNLVDCSWQTASH